MIIPSAQRKKIYERADGLCELCKAPLGWRSGVHHNPACKMGGTKHIYRDDELVVVCGRCQSKAHGLREAESDR